MNGPFIGLRSVVALATAGAMVLATALAAAAPAPGRYAAELCVTTAPGATPGCGPAEVDIQSSGRLRVRVSDISYRLLLKSSQVDVVLMHGTMQIDEFTAPYEWAGPALRFVDADKQATYDLRLGERRPPN